MFEAGEKEGGEKEDWREKEHRAVQTAEQLRLGGFWIGELGSVRLDEAAI